MNAWCIKNGIAISKHAHKSNYIWQTATEISSYKYLKYQLMHQLNKKKNEEKRLTEI